MGGLLLLLRRRPGVVDLVDRGLRRGVLVLGRRGTAGAAAVTVPTDDRELRTDLHRLVLRDQDPGQHAGGR
jgi:hypothetical protein